MDMLQKTLPWLVGLPFVPKIVVSVIVVALATLVLILIWAPSNGQQVIKSENGDGGTISEPVPAISSSQSTYGDFSPVINAGRDVRVNINKPETILKYEPPTINSFRGYHNGSTFLVLENDARVPITLTKEVDERIDGVWDYTIEFEILNKSKADIKVKSVLIEVLSVDAIEPIKYYRPESGLGEARLYICRFDGQIGRYLSDFGESGKYLFLQSGEQETIKIALNTKDEGRYTLRVLLDLSTVEGLKTVSVGEVSDVRILKRSRI